MTRMTPKQRFERTIDMILALEDDQLLEPLKIVRDYVMWEWTYTSYRKAERRFMKRNDRMVQHDNNYVAMKKFQHQLEDL